MPYIEIPRPIAMLLFAVVAIVAIGAMFKGQGPQGGRHA